MTLAGRGREPWPIAFFAVAWGLLVLATLPRGVVAMNDDFGYLRSVVATLQHHRPWTDDWLEPWSASLSSLSALLLLATGNFYVATVGLQAAMAAVSFWALASLLQERTGSRPLALIGAGLVLSFPVLLWKTVEYTSMVICMPCFFLAVLLAERRRWLGFFVCFAVSLASRQSTITWLALPGYVVLRALIVAEERRQKVWLAPVLAIAAGLGWFAVLALTMNPTHAREASAIDMADHFSAARAVRHLAVGALGYFVAAGLGAFLRSFGQPPLPRRKAGIVFWAIGALAGAVLMLNTGDLVEREYNALFTPLPFEPMYLRFLVALAAGGWLGWRFRLRGELAVAAAGCLVMAGLRLELWDYYLFEAVILGFLSPAVPFTSSQVAADDSSSRPSTKFPPVRIALGALAAFHFAFLVQLKMNGDRALAVASVHEYALRTGGRTTSEFSRAPFGYEGWYLYPYFITHEGADDPRISQFVRYARKSVQLNVSYDHALPSRILSETSQSPDAHRPVLADETHSIAWLFHGRFVLQRAELAAPDDPVPSAGGFPLNNQEWRQLIAGQPLTPKP